jgi:glucan 1,3-beta-glucosidase
LAEQQYLFKTIPFNGCHTAIGVDSQFFATFLNMNFTNCGTGIDVSNCNTGDISLIDNSNSLTVNHKQTGTLPSTNKPSSLLINGKYLTKTPPQYGQFDYTQFASVKDVGAMGDGRTDDTAAINAALAANAGCKITYFPHGVYLVTNTVHVPPGSRIVGEVWSVISGIIQLRFLNTNANRSIAANSNFGDLSNPRPLIQVGNPGDVGVAELSDLILTTADILPGTILLQINMAGTNPGDVSTSNVHIRVGGAADTNVDRVCSESDQPCLDN